MKKERRKFGTIYYVGRKHGVKERYCGCIKLQALGNGLRSKPGSELDVILTDQLIN
jgi:hypothetical protein